MPHDVEPLDDPGAVSEPALVPNETVENPNIQETVQNQNTPETVNANVNNEQQVPATNRRYPSRNHKKPDKLNL